MTSCGPDESVPAVLGPTVWRLTVSPIEPASGIQAEVTMQSIDDLGRTLRAAADDVPPHARGRELNSGAVVWSGPAQIDSRGTWKAPLIFTAPGRWQVVIHEAIDPRLSIRETDRLTWPIVNDTDPTLVVRDAVGQENLSLLLTVIPDRGPILWWLRTHIPEVLGIVVILTASVASYLLRGRLMPPPGR